MGGGSTHYNPYGQLHDLILKIFSRENKSSNASLILHLPTPEEAEDLIDIYYNIYYIIN